MAKTEEDVINEISEEKELELKVNYEKKDMKERRQVLKNELYDGSKKLKHQVPKGKGS